jgi:hypothetical protein
MQATAAHEDWMVAKQKKIFQATDDTIRRGAESTADHLTEN